jgi:hypothetical protein
MVGERAADERANDRRDAEDGAEQAEQARAVLEPGGLPYHLQHRDDWRDVKQTRIPFKLEYDAQIPAAPSPDTVRPAMR